MAASVPSKTTSVSLRPRRPAAGGRGLARATSARALGLVLTGGAVVFVALASLAVGSKTIPLATVVDALTSYDKSDFDHVVVHSLRGPRTIVGLLVGVALGLAGAVMQGVTRNPLADPGILGVNAGAALCVVLGIYAFGITSVLGYVWFAFLGAAVAGLFVYAIGSLGREGATPIKLALAGAALTAVLMSFTTTVLLLDAAALNAYRFWAVGSLAAPTGDVARTIWPFVAVGTVMALVTGRLLNALALGDDVARALGQRVGRARAFCAASVVLLCGAAVAVAGPIAFVGLTVPHMARAIVGPDYRWILPYSALLAPVLLLGSDVVGRVVARPSEVQVGVITALIGAPLFVTLVRFRRLAEI